MPAECYLVTGGYILQHFILLKQVSYECVSEIIVLFELFDQFSMLFLLCSSDNPLDRFRLQCAEHENILMLVLQVFFLPLLVSTVVVNPWEIFS